MEGKTRRTLGSTVIRGRGGVGGKGKAGRGQTRRGSNENTFKSDTRLGRDSIRYKAGGVQKTEIERVKVAVNDTWSRIQR